MTPDELHKLLSTYDQKDYAKGFVDGFMEAVELMQVKFKDVPPPKDQSDCRD